MATPYDRRYQLGQSMLGQGLSGAPIQHWTQGLARLMQAYQGRKMIDEAEQAREKEEERKRQSLIDTIGAYFGGQPMPQYEAGQIPDQEEQIPDQEEQIPDQEKQSKRQSLIGAIGAYRGDQSMPQVVPVEKFMADPGSFTSSGKEGIPTKVGTVQNRRALLQALAGVSGYEDLVAKTMIGQAFADPAATKSKPSSIQEYEYWQGLPEDKREEYLNIKRSTEGVRTINLADRTVIIDKYGNVIGEYEKGLAPTQTPEYKSEVKKAEEVAKVEGAKAAAAPRRAGEISGVLSLVDDISGDEAIESIYGTISGMTPTFMQGSTDLEAKIGRLNDVLSLEEREKLKGQGTITDNESDMLARSISILNNFRISPKEAMIELQRIRDILAGKYREATGQEAPPAQSKQDLYDEYGLER